jgi:hypothetical protein
MPTGKQPVVSESAAYKYNNLKAIINSCQFNATDRHMTYSAAIYALKLNLCPKISVL